MIQDKYLAVHEYLKEIMSVPSLDKLEEITARYREELGDLDEVEAVLWEDSVTLGKELVYLKTGTDDDMGRGLLATLSDTEREELKESDKIIDDNLFGYHFQPIVSVSTGEIFSYEALMRPRSDIPVSPLQILKYAKLRNRLNDIERATFLNVLKIIDHNSKFFHGKKIFINSIPKTRFSEEDQLVVNELLMRHSRSVVVELTERAELDEEEFAGFKERYRTMNVQTAIDDYGTGYSNVQNLLRYMPDYVKIDRSLLSGMQDDPKKRHFVREIIEFCHSNGIMALAEGVETSEELRSVILLGADLIQGYYTARPAAEPIEDIPFEIRQEIRNYLHERQEGEASQIYAADSGEHIELERLVKNETVSILIGSDGDYYISGKPGLEAEIDIEIADNVKAEITIENVRLLNKKKLPCIDIGKECEVLLIVKGDNRLNLGGICVPEGTGFILKGDGNLKIILDGDEYFGIGNGINSGHGNLVFEHSGTLKIETNGKIGVCIGSGFGGGINIAGGQFVLEMNGDRALGIGTLYRDGIVTVDNSDITAEMNTIKGVAFGSFGANADVTISNTSVKLYISGKEAVAMGTVSGERCDVYVHDASVIMNIQNDRCSGVAALDGLTGLTFERGALRIYAHGESVLPFGGFSGDTDISFKDSDVTTKVNTALNLEDYISKDRVEILHGRVRVVFNDSEFQLTE
ncbi:MAG: EAL domain-containing protein [Lachnospiraceae bacterium]|nr:EAL domain-containing protein [Lachnospiraceae bacterium]